MKKIALIPIFAVLVVAAGGVWFLLLRPKTVAAPAAVGPQVCFGNNCYGVELAQTQVELERGLMYKTSLASNAGMIFIFGQDGDEPFWMKNTLIPLDMVWIDSAYRVVFIKHDAQPCTPNVCPLIDPGVNARYVLEVNAGEMDRIKTKTGDLASFNNIR